MKDKANVYERYRYTYKTNKHLGGLIKITKTLDVKRVGCDINIEIPKLIDYDRVYINGREVKLDERY